MSDRLTPCSACGRHVRVSDVRCPFCGSEGARPAPRAVRVKGRPGRAALYAIGIGTAALGAAACGGSVEARSDAAADAPTSTSRDAAAESETPGMDSGAPVQDGAAPDTTEADDAADDVFERTDGMPAPPYGAPIYGSPPPPPKPDF